MFEREKWSGKPLLSKIQLISFLVVYIFFPFIIQLLRAPEGEEIPTTNVLFFIFIVIGIGFYVLMLAWYSEHLLRKQSEKFAGRRVLVGTNEEGGGKGEDFEFIIKEMFPFEIEAEFVKEGVKRVEDRSEQLKIESKMKVVEVEGEVVENEKN